MKTLLNCVNEVLKRVSIIQGDSGLLTSLTDSGRQIYIDVAVQVWNEVIDDLYVRSDMALPKVQASATITLVTNDRDYVLNSSLTRLHYPLEELTLGKYITEYPGGYNKIIDHQPIPANETGEPRFAAINPEDGELYLDRIPTSNENGQVFTYRYDTDLVMTVLTDTVPFADVVFRALVPAVKEMWMADQRNSFNPLFYKKSLATAMKYLIQKKPEQSYRPARYTGGGFDPYAR